MDWTEGMNKTRSIGGGKVVLLAVLCLVIAACGPRAAGPRLIVDDLHLTLMPSGARFVTGAVQNESDRPVGGAQVQITLFDGKNRRVDGMFAVVLDIPPNGRVEFRAAVTSDYDVRGARARSVLVINP